MDEQSKHIINLAEADFLSFLYSERERENGLSQHTGWNNWALVGAFVAIVCAGYAIVKDSRLFNWIDVLYYSGGLFALFLIYHSWWRFITKRERGVDFSKVRTLKEVVPYVQIVFMTVIAVSSAVLIAIFDGFNTVFWWWIGVLILVVALCGVIVLLKNKLVPSFFEELFLPWPWVNVALVSFLSLVLSIVKSQSFKMVAVDYLSEEFSVSVCVVACLVVVFIFFTINFKDKSVRRFDEIIDKYLYLGSTKEETLHEVIKNRMGYGVIDSCEKELKQVQEKLSVCEKEEDEINSIRQTVLAGGYNLSDLRSYQKRLNVILALEQDAIKSTKNLSERMSEIVKVSSFIKEKSDLEKLFNVNEALYEKVKSMTSSISEILQTIDEKEFAKTEDAVAK